MQLYQPERGGWNTVLTANTREALETSARVLSWQTGKPLRLVDPDGAVLEELQPPRKVAA